MTDSRLRQLERAYHHDDDDPATLAALIAGKRRAGEQIPGWLLDQEVHPGRVFEPGYAFEVYADLPGEGLVSLGRTTSRRSVDVPDNYAWWVKPLSVGKAWPSIVAALRAHRVPGLALDHAQIRSPDLALLADLPQLVWLSLANCGRISDSGLEELADHAPQLRHLNLDRCAHKVHVNSAWLQRMPNLIHLKLRDRAGDTTVEEIVAGAPRLTRLRVGNKRLTNEGVARLAGLSELTRLELCYASRVSAKGLKLLATLPRLMHLDLLQCARAKGPSLSALAKLPHLISLGYYRAIDPKDLEGLRKLKQVRHMNLWTWGSPRSRAIHERILQELAQKLPECTIRAVEAPPHGWVLAPLGET